MSVAPSASQLDEHVPENFPFRFVTRSIGSGAYAAIKKARPLHASEPVIAIKLISKDHAFKHGRLTPKALGMEVQLHKYLGRHRHIIEFYQSGDDPMWLWIAMELASNGDLFDKIEADIGVGEDIAQLYFTQLMSAVGYMHGKGVAHRDLKPENILVAGNGDLKIADFGLAALFRHGDKVRTCNTVCGSPPYIAPEVVNGRRMGKRQDLLETGYDPGTADIWSCGVILFTLLVGNTPWDEPTMRSHEFGLYTESGGRTGDELWDALPKDTISLLRGMMKLDVRQRFKLDDIRRHPWMNRKNNIMDSSGRARDPIALATQMMESLKVNFDISRSSQRQSQRRADTDAMDTDMDVEPDFTRSVAATQPETPLNEIAFDWEHPMSQPMRSRAGAKPTFDLMDRLMDDPALSQFTQTPSVPLSLTQMAKRFGDIVPATSLTQFLSILPLELLIETVLQALSQLNVPATPLVGDDMVSIRIKTRDGRGQSLHGQVVITQWNDQVLEVRFVKLKGDPLEWRRFFKNVCACCKDAILRPDQAG